MARWLVFLALVGCNTVPPQWAGVPATRVDVDGTIFDVRRKGNQAFAFRRTSEWAPNLRSMMLPAGRAIQEATGCTVVPGTYGGDQVFVTAMLRC